MLGKLKQISELAFDDRLKYDIEAFKSSAPLFINKAWNLLEEVGADTLLHNGITVNQLMEEKNIKNKEMLECMLDTLVGSGVLKYKDSKYFFLNSPKPATTEQMDFLQKYYAGSLRWIEFVSSKAKQTLVEGKAPKETGFEHEESLELWDTIMEESPYSGRIITINKFVSELKDDSSVLDLGCGGGIGLEAILRNVNKNIDIVGAEVSKEYLERAKIRIRKISSETTNQLIRDNLNRLQFIHFDPNKGMPKNRKYDAVFISIVLNHIKPEKRGDLFKDIKDLLNENGILALYQLIHQSKFNKNPICWIMHTVPSHIEYPFREEYIKELKNHFKSVEEFMNGVVVIARN